MSTSQLTELLWTSLEKLLPPQPGFHIHHIDYVKLFYFYFLEKQARFIDCSKNTQGRA